MLDQFRAHLEWAEGRRRMPYRDTQGHLTIGVGRNLDAKGLSDEEIDLLLEHDMGAAIQNAKTLPYWHDLVEARKIVVADLVFNLGLRGWLGFVRANEALVAGDYDVAAAEMQDSLWYRQTGRRARRLVEAMRSGEWRG